MDIETYLAKYKMTQKDLARKCGLFDVSIHAYKNGSRPRYETAKKIVDAYIEKDNQKNGQEHNAQVRAVHGLSLYCWKL